MATTYKDLFETYIKYTDYLLSRTNITHQYTKNIQGTGSEIESEIRELLSTLLPNRFKVTHGFICYAEDNVKEPVVSPQLDCIIVDTLVPHTIFSLSQTSGEEIVPLESVVGIFEIKRTLTKATINNAIQHLSNAAQILGISKTNSSNYLPTGLSVPQMNTGIFSNPMLGILGVENRINMKELVKNDSILAKEYITKCDNSKIDIIGCFSGFFMCTMSDDKENFQPFPCREEGKRYFYGIGTGKDEIIRTALISRIIGFIISYLVSTSGKFNPMDKYYFHRSTWPIKQ